MFLFIFLQGCSLEIPFSLDFFSAQHLHSTRPLVFPSLPRAGPAQVIVSVMHSTPTASWAKFLASLGFEQRLEFNEGLGFGLGFGFGFGFGFAAPPTKGLGVGCWDPLMRIMYMGSCAHSLIGCCSSKVIAIGPELVSSPLVLVAVLGSFCFPLTRQKDIFCWGPNSSLELWTASFIERLNSCLCDFTHIHMGMGQN